MFWKKKDAQQEVDTLVKQLNNRIETLKKQVDHLEEFTLRTISAEQKGLLWLKDKVSDIEQKIEPLFTKEELNKAQEIRTVGDDFREMKKKKKIKEDNESQP